MVTLHTQCPLMPSEPILTELKKTFVQSTVSHSDEPSAEETPPQERSTRFQPPCGIWSLVALLRLLECHWLECNCMKLGCSCMEDDVMKWMLEPSHPALAGQVLQVSSYPMPCSKDNSSHRPHCSKKKILRSLAYVTDC